MGDRTVIGDLDFEDDLPRPMRGESGGRILGLDATEEAGFGLIGIEPGTLDRGELGGCRCFCHGVVDLFGGRGLQAENEFTFLVDD